MLNESVVATADYLSYPCTHHFRPTEYLEDLRSLLKTSEQSDKLEPDRRRTSIAVDDVVQVDEVALPLGESATPSNETALDAVAQQGARGKVTDAPVNSVETGVGMVQARSEATPLVNKPRQTSRDSLDAFDRLPASVSNTVQDSSAPQATVHPVQPTEHVRRSSSSQWNVIVAVVLSVILSGGGQLYLGQTKKGLILVSLVIITWAFVFIRNGGGYSVLCAIWLVALAVYGVADAVQTIDRVSHNREKNLIAVVVLSVIFSGAGHLYLGQTRKGLILMGLVFAAWVFIVLGEAAFDGKSGGITGVFFLGLIALAIYGASDAARSIDRANHTRSEARR